jgi:hypothetical protein
MAAYNKAPRDGDPQGNAPAQKNWVGLDAYPSILPCPTRRESQLLARRIGQLRAPRALGVAGLQAAAGRIIDAHPDCPIRASRLVDRLTVAMDLAQVEGRWS